jgi:hypothetical protein
MHLVERPLPGVPDRSDTACSEEFRVVWHAIPEDRNDSIQSVDVFRWIAFNNEEIGVLAGENAPDLDIAAQSKRRMIRSRLNRLHRGESGVDQPAKLTMQVPENPLTASAQRSIVDNHHMVTIEA